MAGSLERLEAALETLKAAPGRPDVKALCKAAGVCRATANRYTETMDRFRALQLERAQEAAEAKGGKAGASPSARRAASKETNRKLRRSIDDWANLVQIYAVRNHALEQELTAMREGKTASTLVPFRKTPRV